MTLMPNHYGAPCHRQPGAQRWHLRCALLHPVRFVRTRSVVMTADPPSALALLCNLLGFVLLVAAVVVVVAALSP